MSKETSNAIGPHHRLDLSTLVRLSLSELPGGAIIAGAWSEWDSNQRFQRIQQALDEMARQLRALQDATPQPHIEPADFQILDEVVERAQREHSERKRLDYGRLLASSLVRHDVPFDEKRSFVRARDEFEDVHIRILGLLWQVLVDSGPQLSYHDLVESLFGKLPADHDPVLLPALDLLATRYAFVSREWRRPSSDVIGFDELSPERVARNCVHWLTETGVRFLEFLDPTGASTPTPRPRETLTFPKLTADPRL